MVRAKDFPNLDDPKKPRPKLLVGETDKEKRRIWLMCDSKRQYLREEDTKAVIRNAFRRGTKLRAYQCTVCGLYHVTNKTKKRIK